VRPNATAPTVSLFPQKRLSAHYNGHGIEAFCRLAGRHAVVTNYEWQRNVVCYFGHSISILPDGQHPAL
jgi:hypothetical protein